MDVVLSDSLDQNKQIEFLRRAASLSGKLVPVEEFRQTTCRLMERICST